MRSGLDLTLYLVRHGQTPTNLANQTIGQPPDEPLDDTGKAQAQLLGERLRKEVMFDGVFCSSYLRAHDTLKIAEPKYAGTYITGIEELREIDQGIVLGKNRSEFFKSPEDFDRYKRNGMGFSFPGGESQYDVLHRAWGWLDKEILSNPYTRVDNHLDLLVMSHGMTIKTILSKITGWDHRMTGRCILDNTSISKVSLRHDDWFLVSINDTAHLHNTEHAQ